MLFIVGMLKITVDYRPVRSFKLEPSAGFCYRSRNSRASPCQAGETATSGRGLEMVGKALVSRRVTQGSLSSRGILVYLVHGHGHTNEKMRGSPWT